MPIEAATQHLVQVEEEETVSPLPHTREVDPNTQHGTASEPVLQHLVQKVVEDTTRGRMMPS